MASESTPTLEPLNARQKRRGSQGRWIIRVLTSLFLLAACGGVIVLGLQLRDWTWRTAEPIRWNNINNAWRWGTAVVETTGDAPGPVPTSTLLRNCFAFYERVQSDRSLQRDPLDYPPLRLLGVCLWVNYIRGTVPDATSFDAAYAWPMLAMNSACTLIAAAASLLLVHRWVSQRHLPAAPSRWRALWQRLARRKSRPALPLPSPYAKASPFHSWALGVLAAMLVWFNPAVILESHAWPQWDIWPVPFFLLALLLASLDGWLAAGVMLAVGALMKGQLLIVAPVVILWPLFLGDFWALLRIMTGFAAAAAVAISPWLLRDALAWRLFLAAPFVGALLPLLLRRWRAAIYAAVAAIPVGLLAAACLGKTSMAWYEVGILTGTTKFELMARNCASNLPAILAKMAGWKLGDVVFTIGPSSVEMKTLLMTLYGATLLLCGWGAARHTRRNDPRALIALVTPWVLMYTLIGQMDGRYLLYGACASAIFVAAGLEFIFFPLLLTAMNFSAMLKFLLQKQPHLLPRTWEAISPLEPGIGWALLLAAGILLHQAITVRRTVSPPMGGYNIYS